MANLRINNLKPKFVNTQKHLYSDIKLDLEFNYTTNNELLKEKQIKDCVISNDYDAIKNSIVSLFTTMPGQKILNPYFGLGLTKYLFEPINEDIANNIANTITQGIQTYEPRIRIINVNVGFSAERQEYVITLNFSVPQIGNNAFKLVGTLSNSGFFLNN